MNQLPELRTLLKICTLFFFVSAYAMESESTQKAPAITNQNLRSLIANRLEIVQKLSQYAQEVLEFSKSFPTVHERLTQFIGIIPSIILDNEKQKNADTMRLLARSLAPYADQIETFFVQAKKVRDTSTTLLKNLSLETTTARTASIADAITKLAEYYFDSADTLSPELSDTEVDSTYIAPIHTFLETEKKEEEQEKAAARNALIAQYQESLKQEAQRALAMQKLDNTTSIISAITQFAEDLAAKFPSLVTNPAAYYLDPQNTIPTLFTHCQQLVQDVVGIYKHIEEYAQKFTINTV